MRDSNYKLALWYNNTLLRSKRFGESFLKQSNPGGLGIFVLQSVPSIRVKWLPVVSKQKRHQCVSHPPSRSYICVLTSKVRYLDKIKIVVNQINSKGRDLPRTGVHRRCIGILLGNVTTYERYYPQGRRRQVSQ